MILINNLNLPLDFDFSDLKPLVAREIGVDISKIKSAELFRRSVDARKKNDVHFCCSVSAEISSNEEKAVKHCKKAVIYNKKGYVWKRAEQTSELRPIVVGFGPAGMFAALTLARAGLKPIILERGYDVETRKRDVEEFFSGGSLKENSNVQFGEGGAGTFSDGKLNTGIKDYRCRAVLEEFVKHGAGKNILTDAKPHIGTDVLTGVVKSIRKEIIALGGQVRFGSRLKDLKLSGCRLCLAVTEEEEISCDSLILATGHSARDVFSLLKQKDISMAKKPFSMGVRIEHLQRDINRTLYGDFAEHPALNAADYKLAEHLESGRGVYTFCMCPGGEVINASSETGGIAVNGMSNSKRDGVNANSAVLVNVDPEDLPEDILSGCELQRRVEQAAYNAADGAVPVNTVDNFCFGKPFEITDIKPTVKPRYAYSDFKDIYPDYILESLKEGILLFDRKIKGFAKGSAVLTAPETRSSSPIRILRGEDFQSVSVKGIYPCGEGAGYAGGIMSAAVDGIKTAEAVILNLGGKACE